MIRSISRRWCALYLCLSVCVISGLAATEPFRDQGITISTDFPGGNAQVVSVVGDTITITPDLRGGREWFYWNFRIVADRAGTFTFVVKTASPFMGMIGMQGPAISTDGDKTWNWLGAESMVTPNRSFTYTLAKDAVVQFSSTIPYRQRELDLFVQDIAKHPHVTMAELCRTQKGRPVELITIGAPGPQRQVVLFTLRHHACETIISFVLEGFIRAAMADDEDGKRFRERYVLHVVPIVDKDGVEEGDQGKNRRPHDHNRDYIDEPLFPEVRAIKRLAADKRITMALDWHCPTLSMDIHQAVYFLGPKNRPATNLDNVTRLFAAMKAELPKQSPGMYRVDLADEDQRSAAMCADFFSRQPGMNLAATLEFPFAPKGKDMRPDACREYGAAFLRAWNRTEFSAVVP